MGGILQTCPVTYELKLKKWNMSPHSKTTHIRQNEILWNQSNNSWSTKRPKGSPYDSHWWRTINKRKKKETNVTISKETKNVGTILATNCWHEMQSILMLKMFYLKDLKMYLLYEKRGDKSTATSTRCSISAINIYSGDIINANKTSGFLSSCRLASCMATGLQWYLQIFHVKDIR